jgi:acyl dehydratase
MATYESSAALLEYQGQRLGISEWQQIEQDKINAFADLTGDHQWIHLDEQRASAESPFGRTVVHGAFTLALCTSYLAELIHIDDAQLVVNAGWSKVRFPAPAPVGSRIRCVATLDEVREIPNGARVTVQAKVEIEDASKPACTAHQVLVFYR